MPETSSQKVSNLEEPRVLYIRATQSYSPTVLQAFVLYISYISEHLLVGDNQVKNEEEKEKAP